jgi:hypothetical protein
MSIGIAERIASGSLETSSTHLLLGRKKLVEAFGCPWFLQRIG